LTPAGDQITIVPKLLTLAPGASRNVRVGAAASGFGAVEGTYRLFVEELPDNAAPKDPGTVAIRMEVGVPIFLRPSKPASSGQIASVAFERGHLVTRVHNTGNVHMVVSAVQAKGTDGSGGTKFDTSVPGWYILAGDVQIFDQ